MTPPLPAAPVHLITDDAGRLECHPAYAAFRPTLANRDTYLTQLRQQAAEGFHLAAFREPAGQVSSLMGFRCHTTTAWGKILYIDDLTTLPEARGRGQGSTLLRYAETVAAAWGCQELHLDSGHQRFDAHRLYHNFGYRITSHHFSRKL